jgi:predicted nucleic acid-binding protein
MYLLDTNIWLERLLDQDKSETVGKFLDAVPSEVLFISDFSFHSIGVILCRIKKRDVLTQFTDDVFTNGEVSLLSLEPEDIVDIVEIIEEYNLDFDDAYQYITAKKNDLILVSFDSDFNKTERGRKTPEAILADYAE